MGYYKNEILGSKYKTKRSVDIMTNETTNQVVVNANEVKLPTPQNVAIPTATPPVAQIEIPKVVNPVVNTVATNTEPIQVKNEEVAIAATTTVKKEKVVVPDFKDVLVTSIAKLGISAQDIKTATPEKLEEIKNTLFETVKTEAQDVKKSVAEAVKEVKNKEPKLSAKEMYIQFKTNLETLRTDGQIEKCIEIFYNECVEKKLQWKIDLGYMSIKTHMKTFTAASQFEEFMKMIPDSYTEELFKTKIEALKQELYNKVLLKETKEKELALAKEKREKEKEIKVATKKVPLVIPSVANQVVTGTATEVVNSDTPTEEENIQKKFAESQAKEYEELLKQF